MRKLVLIGSGLHKHSEDNATSVLSDWRTLLSEVCRKHRLHGLEEHYAIPTECWERMILAKAKRSPKKRAAKAEAELRKTVAELIKGASSCPRDGEAIRGLANFLRQGGNHLVTINFDTVGFCAYRKKWAPSPNAKRRKNPQRESRLRDSDWMLLYGRRLIDSEGSELPSMIWHPHGCVDCPQSIRLGLRDYGFLPHCYREAFETFKAWQRNQLGWRKNASDLLTPAENDRLLEKLEAMDRGELTDRISAQADHWVTRFMLLPTVVIGAGLSEHEFGLRWLLVQRARNLARVPRAAQIEHFTQSTPVPLGVTRREFEDWQTAWDTALNQP